MQNNFLKAWKSHTNGVDYYCISVLELGKHNLEGNLIFILPDKIRAGTHPPGASFFASILNCQKGGYAVLYSADKNVTLVIAMQVLKYMPNKTINYISHALGVNCISS